MENIAIMHITRQSCNSQSKTEFSSELWRYQAQTYHEKRAAVANLS